MGKRRLHQRNEKEELLKQLLRPNSIIIPILPKEKSIHKRSSMIEREIMRE